MYIMYVHAYIIHILCHVHIIMYVHVCSIVGKEFG